MSVNLSDLDLTEEQLLEKLRGFEHDMAVNKVLQQMNRSAIRNYKKLIKAVKEAPR